MPEALKHMYSSEFVQSLSISLNRRYLKFSKQAFEQRVFCEDWPDMELKARMRHITESVASELPDDYRTALEILKAIATDAGVSEMGDFKYMFLPDFVELYGLDDFEASVEALAYFTCYASSEFAVRPFLIKYPQQMITCMLQWSESDSFHIRRLASEGCRPRLPWAMALPAYKKDPLPILGILENLKQDSSLFVRRSVANNLNDIAKDNESVVLGILKKWHGRNEELNWVVKHGCRTLLKAGHPEVLEIFGFLPPHHIQLVEFTCQSGVAMGDTLEFQFKVKAPKLGKLRIEYQMGFVKANGKQAGKIFKISESEYSESEKLVVKRHSFRPISTRKYYPGKHSLSIIINGHSLGQLSFDLHRE